MGILYEARGSTSGQDEEWDLLTETMPDQSKIACSSDAFTGSDCPQIVWNHYIDVLRQYGAEVKMPTSGTGIPFRFAVPQSTYGWWATETSGSWIGYDFGHPVCVKEVRYLPWVQLHMAQLQGSNDTNANWSAKRWYVAGSRSNVIVARYAQLGHGEGIGSACKMVDNVVDNLTPTSGAYGVEYAWKQFITCNKDKFRYYRFAIQRSFHTNDASAERVGLHSLSFFGTDD